MNRPLCTVTVVVILAGGVQHGRAQSPPVTSSSQAALDEARRLNRAVAKLFGEGKFQEAIPAAERSLALREQVLGPMHADVAMSLNSLALLYDAQGAYGKAESLYLRALDIAEKVLGRMHPNVATGLNNLAGLYEHQGAYG